jgi:hypothetical protein
MTHLLVTNVYSNVISIVICVDAEDGNTQSMKLQVETNDDDTTEWLHISENKQWMTGLTLKVGKHSFRLGATDSSGQSAYDAFVVLLSTFIFSNYFNTRLISQIHYQKEAPIHIHSNLY